MKIESEMAVILRISIKCFRKLIFSLLFVVLCSIHSFKDKAFIERRAFMLKVYCQIQCFVFCFLEVFMHGSILVRAFFRDHFMLLFGLRMCIYKVLYTSHIAADIRDHVLEEVPGTSISNQSFSKSKKKTVLEWNCLNFLCIDAQLPWKMPTIILEYTTCPYISLYFLTTFSFGTYVFFNSWW